MAPTIPVGACIEADYDALDDAAPRVDDIVIFHPPRAAEHARDDGSTRCGAPRRARQMCSRPVPRLSRARFLKRVVGYPGDRLRLRRGRLTRNSQRLDEPFTDRSTCGKRWRGCDFRHRITVPRDHYFLLGDNRGGSDDSRFWGPVPRRALLALVGRCTAPTGEPCAVAPGPAEH